MSGPWHRGLRLLAFILCLGVIIAMVQPVTAEPSTEAAAEPTSRQPKQAAAFTYTAVLHRSASLSSQIIGQMKDGQQVFVQGEAGSLYKIDSFGITAYIAKQQVQQQDDGNYYVKCDPASSETRTMQLISRVEAQTLRDSLLRVTKKQIGYRYVFGGARPGGFDCSGLTYYVYGQNGIQLPRGGGSQPAVGIAVAKEDLQVGDLVFFRIRGETYFMSHVGIYAGNNQVIHSGSRGVGYANLDNQWFAATYLCARRLVLESQCAIMLLPAASADSVLDYNRSTEGLRTAE